MITTKNGELVLELMNAVKGESKDGISKSLAKERITPQSYKSLTGLGMFLEGSEKELEITSLGWGVGFQCTMVAFPYLERGAVIMTNTEMGVHQLEGIIGEIYKSVLSKIRGRNMQITLANPTKRKFR